MPEARATLNVPRSPLAWGGQVLLYGAFAAFIGVFSQWPSYHHLAPDEAVIKISFIHAGKPVADCVRPDPKELEKLPPNMRAPVKCPRERSPITISVDVDGVNVLTDSAPPSGLSRDGASAVYRRLVVPAGKRELSVQLSDNVRAREQPYRRTETIDLAAGKVLVIDFDPEKGGITFQ